MNERLRKAYLAKHCSHEAFCDPDDGGLVHERQLHVQLRELRLPVRPQVLLKVQRMQVSADCRGRSWILRSVVRDWGPAAETPAAGVTANSNAQTQMPYKLC